MIGCRYRGWQVGFFASTWSHDLVSVCSILSEQASTLRLEAFFLWRVRERNRRIFSTGCTDELLLFLESWTLSQDTSEGMWYNHLLLACLAGSSLVDRRYLAFGGLLESPSLFLQMRRKWWSWWRGLTSFGGCSPDKRFFGVRREGLTEAKGSECLDSDLLYFFFKNINTKM